MLKDSGERREFESGAARDIQKGKGRCDLLPLEVVGNLLTSRTLLHINDYVYRGDTASLYTAVTKFVSEANSDKYTVLLEVSTHYEAGAEKYSERNWEKGIPLHCYIDSGVRHYLKFMRGDTDEPHDRAFIWNMLGAIWTHNNKPELIDLPFKAATEPTKYRSVDLPFKEVEEG